MDMSEQDGFSNRTEVGSISIIMIWLISLKMMVLLYYEAVELLKVRCKNNMIVHANGYNILESSKAYLYRNLKHNEWRPEKQSITEPNSALPTLSIHCKINVVYSERLIILFSWPGIKSGTWFLTSCLLRGEQASQLLNK